MNGLRIKCNFFKCLENVILISVKIALNIIIQYNPVLTNNKLKRKNILLIQIDDFNWCAITYYIL